MTHSYDLADEAMSFAREEGASAAEVLVSQGTEFSTNVRLGTVEKLSQARFRKLGLRVFHGRRAALCSTCDFSRESLRTIASDTVAMARASVEDPDAGLPDEADYGRETPALTTFYPRIQQLTPDDKIGLAQRCEQAARSFDPRITNSEGASFSDSVHHNTYANSWGVRRSYSKTVASLSVVPMAHVQGDRQRDYWLTTHLDSSKLDSPETVGRTAAARTLRRLQARQIQTCEVPVVFDPLTAASLCTHIADAVSGLTIVRKASFLAGMLGRPVAAPIVNLVDEAALDGGIGSRPFDSEGIGSQRTCVIENGVLGNYLLDSYSARKLNRASTANSNREATSPPSIGPSNFYLQPGTDAPGDLIASVQSGLYVTELLGFGVNLVTGDYSRGATGLWIENGELAFPVEEITIAGNLKDMLTGIAKIGNDLTPLSAVFSPTVLIERMTVSGN